MPSDHENFEIQISREGRWITNSVRDSETLARQLAKQLLQDKKCAGVRILGNTAYRDGSTRETVLFEQTQSVADNNPIRINPIETARPACTTSRDFFGLESRIILNRIFRSYLESVSLTPTEVLHSHHNLQRLYDRDQLLPSAVSLVAKLQASGTDQSTRDRQDEIHRLLEQIADQARRADQLDLPGLSDRFSDTLTAVSSRSGETPEYLAMVVLARKLSGINSWIGKLGKLCDLATSETDQTAGLLLDTVIADVLGANVIQEILGWQQSLGSAIISMLDLAEGRFDSAQSDAREIVDVLNRLFAENALPASRHVIVERAMRQLKSSAPLYRADPGKEMEEYQRVLTRLMTPGGILSGAQAAEALTVRGGQFIEEGGATGRKAAIGATVKALPDPARGVMYLAELTNTEIADGHLNDIIEQLDVVFSARVIGELCRRSLSPKERMMAATGAFTVTVSSALPEDVKKRVADHIDGVLERYLIDADVINRLDNPGDHIRDRAVRLVKFCGAGVLPEGKALALARQRVIKLLRQPKFDIQFIDGIPDPVKADKALRDFHSLLIKGGIA